MASEPLIKIMAVASCGGHRMQLERICRELKHRYEIIYVGSDVSASTSLSLPHAMPKEYVVKEFSRQNFWRMIPVAMSIARIIRKERPEAVITTGAAPGLIAVVVGRLMGLKTIWIDSIANAAELSGSGRMAMYIAGHVFTQWRHLAGEKVEYKGNVMGI